MHLSNDRNSFARHTSSFGLIWKRRGKCLLKFSIMRNNLLEHVLFLSYFFLTFNGTLPGDDLLYALNAPKFRIKCALVKKRAQAQTWGGILAFFSVVLLITFLASYRSILEYLAKKGRPHQKSPIFLYCFCWHEAVWLTTNDIECWQKHVESQTFTNVALMLLDFLLKDTGFEITMKNHCDGDIFEHSFRM